MAKRYRICIMTEGDGPMRVSGFTVSSWVPRLFLYLTLLCFMVLSVHAVYSHKMLSGMEDRSLELQILNSEKAAKDLQLAAVTERLHGLEWQITELSKREKDLSLLARDFNLHLGLPAGTELSSIWPELVNTVAWTWGGSAGQGGVDPKAPLDSSPVDVLKGLHRDLDRLEQSAASTEYAMSELSTALKGSRTLLSVTPYANPVPEGKVSSTFGYRSSPFGGGLDFHKGLDLAAPIGTPVYAPADGTVLSADWSKSGYGLMIILDHGYGLTTRYAHLSEALVTVGQKISRGELIAKVGTTGRSTGPHLHYEAILGEVNVDPQNFIQAELEYQSPHLLAKVQENKAAKKSQ
jgi:hypothetical protein